MAIFDHLTLSRVVNDATVRCYKHSAAGPWQVGDTYRRILCTALESGVRYRIMMVIAMRCYAMDRDTFTHAQLRSVISNDLK